MTEASAMADRPLISIALCTYNGARYIREQLDSLVNQTFSSFEVVAVDDCSTDGTLDILDEYARADSRIRVIRNAHNLGFRANFERALSLTSASLIAPCDQDDVWLPEKLQLLLDALGEHALAYSDSEFVDARGRPLGLAMSDKSRLIDIDDPAVFAAGNCVSGHSMLFRRILLERALPVPDCFYYDWWIAAVAASSGGVVYRPEKLVKYRLHDSNVTNVLRSRPVKRRQGYRLQQLRDFQLRVEYLASLPGQSRCFLERLHELWSKREQRWLSPSLAYFIYRHAPRIFALRKPRRSRFKYASKYVFGLRLKRITNSFGYTEPAAAKSAANGGRMAPLR